MIVFGFSERLGRTGAALVSCEETEYAIRMRQALPGTEIVSVPGMRVAHRVPPERTTWRYLVRRCFGEGRDKARVAGLIGPRDGLASERGYTLRILPAGILRGIGDAGRGDLMGLARAATIVAGLSITVAGYQRGRW